MDGVYILMVKIIFGRWFEIELVLCINVLEIMVIKICIIKFMLEYGKYLYLY